MSVTIGIICIIVQVKISGVTGYRSPESRIFTRGSAFEFTISKFRRALFSQKRPDRAGI